MLKNLKERINCKVESDSGAAGTVEMIILIALAVFAALALFTYILTPVQESSEKLGTGVGNGIDKILKSKGSTEGIADSFGGS